MNAPLPDNEEARLQALRAHAILDTPGEAAYDRITRLAARLLNVPIANVTFIDEQRQWFKACYGLSVRESAREISFCGHAILSETPLIVPNALEDPRFRENPLVLGEPNIRFYAGVPLKTSLGLPLGSLCVIDTKPRQFSTEDIGVLEDLAAIVCDELELRLSGLQLQAETAARAHASQALAESLNDLRALEALRDDLTSMIIHDLRNPLSTVIGYLDLFHSQTKGKFNSEESALLAVAQSGADRLNELITSLLDVCRLEAGEMPIAEMECDLASIAADALRAAGPPEKRVTLKLDAPGEPLVTRCDANLISRVISNLLSNAVKYTPASGEVRLTVETDGTQARIQVSDTGAGIPAEYHEKIFEKFGQVDGRKHRHSSGLGLAFCRLAAEAHGGSISLQSKQGVGSTFTVTLPLR